jgi:hypothetical protein
MNYGSPYFHQRLFDIHTDNSVFNIILISIGSNRPTGLLPTGQGQLEKQGLRECFQLSAGIPKSTLRAVT